MTKHPHQQNQLAKFIDRRILELKHKKTQLEIAQETGYPNPNMVTMIKQGRSKVALDRIPKLAAALEVDLAYLMRLALAQDIGQTKAEAVLEAFSEPVTENERGWLLAIREASGDTDPRLTSRSYTALRAIFGA